MSHTPDTSPLTQSTASIKHPRQTPRIPPGSVTNSCPAAVPFPHLLKASTTVHRGQSQESFFLCRSRRLDPARLLGQRAAPVSARSTCRRATALCPMTRNFNPLPGPLPRCRVSCPCCWAPCPVARVGSAVGYPGPSTARFGRRGASCRLAVGSS
jgi:hypothetical protein